MVKEEYSLIIPMKKEWLIHLEEHVQLEMDVLTVAVAEQQLNNEKMDVLKIHESEKEEMADREVHAVLTSPQIYPPTVSNCCKPV